MKTYGFHRWIELSYQDTGAPTKHRKMTGKNRSKARTKLHKSARHAEKNILQSELKDLDIL